MHDAKLFKTLVDFLLTPQSKIVLAQFSDGVYECNSLQKGQGGYMKTGCTVIEATLKAAEEKGFKYVDITRIDLTLCDKYTGMYIPDEDIETALKVIRTLRDWSLDPEMFNADTAVILSHAHKAIVEMVEDVKRYESHENENTTTQENDCQAEA